MFMFSAFVNHLSRILWYFRSWMAFPFVDHPQASHWGTWNARRWQPKYIDLPVSRGKARDWTEIRLAETQCELDILCGFNMRPKTSVSFDLGSTKLHFPQGSLCQVLIWKQFEFQTPKASIRRLFWRPIPSFPAWKNLAERDELVHEWFPWVGLRFLRYRSNVTLDFRWWSFSWWFGGWFRFIFWPMRPLVLPPKQKKRCARGTSDTRCPRIDAVLPQNIDLLMA